MKLLSRTTRALLLLAVARTVQGQDTRLAARLDRPTSAVVNAIVDSARTARLPTAPLVDKALEGSAKGSDGDKIISAVHNLYVRMGSAKRVLGPSTTSDEIKAASGALEVGVSARDLARLRAASGKRPVTLPLAVMSDLVDRNVPIATAVDLVVQLARSGVKDPELVLFQRNVRSDIDRGADPTAAATTRARGLILRTASGSGAKP